MTQRNVFAAISIYALAVFGLAPLISTGLFNLAPVLDWDVAPIHELTADCLKLCAVVFAWPLMWACGFNRREDWGLKCSNGAGQLGKGLVFGLTTAGLTVVVLFLLDVRDWRAGLDSQRVLGALLKASIIAVLVSVIEELWFRGALQRVIGLARGIFVVAAIYAVLHLVRADKPVSDPSAWYAGYEALTGMFGRFADPKYMDGVIALFAAGLFLGWMRWVTGCLAWSLGCHVGWVFQIQLFRRVSIADQTGDYGWIVSAYDQTIGIAFLVILSASWLLFRRRLRAT